MACYNGGVLNRIERSLSWDGDAKSCISTLIGRFWVLHLHNSWKGFNFAT